MPFKFLKETDIGTVRDLYENLPKYIRWDYIDVCVLDNGIELFWRPEHENPRAVTDRKLIEIDVEISNLQREREEILNGER